MIADTPSIGLLLGVPGALIGIAICLGLSALYLIPSGSDRSTPVGLAWLGGAFLVLLVTGVAFWPWQHDYHFWVPINGKVERISSRFISHDKGTSQRFVVVVGGKPYGVDDTRASLLHVGDTVHLKCKREFVFGSGDNGWGCNWNG